MSPQGESTLDGKLFKVQVRTKPSGTIEQMTEFVKWKYFHKLQDFIMSIGTINMKYDTPDVAIEKTVNLIREFKQAYPNSKLALTTLPHIRVSGLKPTTNQVKTDTDKFNARLSSLGDDYIDVIKQANGEVCLLEGMMDGCEEMFVVVGVSIEVDEEDGLYCLIGIDDNGGLSSGIHSRRWRGD
ncbi:unnamed protein product [Didymodactylos carnosus]|uniref:Uncharacterized protein n=1 Tax=Didymodactylos carnosus TaxID=1234261 RepID=A0A8S2KG86_9BILA|nr:unnamed protein product [Didymodactylos carnosus]CAF3843600.1 unnamed protein product [Didymodactylos carnosus]